MKREVAVDPYCQGPRVISAEYVRVNRAQTICDRTASLSEIADRST